MSVPMLLDTYYDTLFDAHLLCEVCQMQPWTTWARWCPALICAGCASGETEPDDTITDDAPQGTCPQCHARITYEYRACMRCHGPTDCLCCDCETPALITPESYL